MSTIAAREAFWKRLAKNNTLFAGFLGGVAPYVMNIANSLVHGSKLDVELTFGYFIGLLLFGLIGLATVSMFQERSRRKAFFLGVSAPSFISLAVQGAAKHETAEFKPSVTVYADSRWSLPFVSTAYAQQGSGTIPGRIAEVQPRGEIDNVTVKMIDADGRVLIEQVIAKMDFERISVPPEATRIFFEKGDSRTDALPLPSTAGGKSYYEVTGGRGKKKIGFLSGILGEARIIYDLKVTQPAIDPLKMGTEGWAFIGKRSQGVWAVKCLDFKQDPAPGSDYKAIAIATLIDKPSIGYNRLGRLIEGQRVHLSGFQVFGGSTPENTLPDNGEIYGRIKIIN